MNDTPTADSDACPDHDCETCKAIGFDQCWQCERCASSTNYGAEPIEVGWYAYSGGAQMMIFHLRSPGQWSVHLDNGTAADCAWDYIEQALGVWDLVLLDPTVIASAVDQGDE